MNDSQLDDLLDELVTVEPRPAWDDVMGRARRAHRRFVAMTAVVGLFVLSPAAWAVDRAFFGSPPPPQIKSYAAELEGFDSQVAAKIAREHGHATADLSKLHGLVQVETPDGPLDVWAAPNSDGGLSTFEAYQADLAPGSDTSIGEEIWDPRPLDAGGIKWESDGPHDDVYQTDGYTDNAHATSAQVTFKIGPQILSKTVPVVEGYYIAVFPRDPSVTSAWEGINVKVAKVVTFDASGKPLETWQAP